MLDTVQLMTHVHQGTAGEVLAFAFSAQCLLVTDRHDA